MSTLTLDLLVCLQIENQSQYLFTSEVQSYIFITSQFQALLEKSQTIQFSDPLFVTYFIFLEALESSI